MVIEYILVYVLKLIRAMHSIATASSPGCNVKTIREPGDEAIGLII